MSDPADRPATWAAWGLVIAPLVFVGGWAVVGASIDGYSPRREAISNLAAVDSPRRWIMFGVFVTYGVAMVVGSFGLRRSVVRAAWPAAVVNGVALIGVAATPIHRSNVVDGLHGLAATVAYLSLAAMPLLASKGLRQAGYPVAAMASVFVGVASLGSFLMAWVSTDGGLFQRTGSTVGDVWILAVGLAILFGPLARPLASERAACT